jgi:hypothetical protein
LESLLERLLAIHAAYLQRPCLVEEAVGRPLDRVAERPPRHGEGGHGESNRDEEGGYGLSHHADPRARARIPNPPDG